MKIVVGSRLKLIGFPETYIQQLLESCTRINPAYTFHLRMIEEHPYMAKTRVEPDPLLIVGDVINCEFPITLLDKVRRDYPSATVVDVRVKKDLKINLLNGINPRPYQTSSVKDLTSFTEGLLSGPTGMGKSFCAIHAICELQQHSLIVVPNKLLVHQMKSNIKDWTGYEAGQIGDGKWLIKDITVATAQTLVSRGTDSISDRFGLVIFDEAHKYTGPSFSKILSGFSSYYRYGMSATLNSTPDKGWTLQKLLGPVRSSLSISDMQKVGAVMKPSFYFIDTPYKPRRKFSEFERTLHLQDLAKHEERNNLIVSKIRSECVGNKCAILVEFVDHVELLAKKLKDLNPIVYHGQLDPKTKKERDTAIKSPAKNITIATYESLSLGKDVPEWELLFMCTPFSSETRAFQAVGRIVRNSKLKKSAKVIDFLDLKDPILASRAEKRRDVYAQIGLIK